MRKRRKTKAVKGGEFNLPEPIIHRIQSFLKRKEAAQTAILSKPWHSAWLSRPNLDFDETDFPRKTDEFFEFAKMTIQRYEQSNLKIETLRLSIIRSDSNRAHDLIVRALKIGATHLSLELRYEVVLTHEFCESGNQLVEISLSGGEIKIDLEMDEKVIYFPKLESLSLSYSRTTNEMFSKFISVCPLIKKLALFGVWGLDMSFLADLSSKFPSLEDLTIDECGGDVREICSPSLKRVTLTVLESKKKIKFDVPSIQKFTFKIKDGPFYDQFPSLSFKATSSREWESHVAIICERENDPFDSSWFSYLKRIFSQLRRSKIHLSLSVESNQSFDYDPRDIQGSHKRQLENVTVDFLSQPTLSCYALFDGLFRICRPKFVTHMLHPDNTNNKFLCETLVRGMNGEFSSPSSFMHGLHDLEEANMELYDEDVAAWRPMPMESFLDGSITAPIVEQNVRFQLKWKP